MGDSLLNSRVQLKGLSPGEDSPRNPRPSARAYASTEAEARASSFPERDARHRGEVSGAARSGERDRRSAGSLRKPAQLLLFGLLAALGAGEKRISTAIASDTAVPSYADPSRNLGDSSSAAPAPPGIRGDLSVPAFAAGDTAADFNLPGPKGQTIGLRKDLLGHGPVVVYFYPGDFTSGCTKEAKEFARLQSSFDSLGVQIVGISVDEPASHERFAEHCGTAFPFLSDTTAAVVQRYGVAIQFSQGGEMRTLARRVTFLLGPDGVVWRVFAKVDPTLHAEEILREIRARDEVPDRE